MIHLEDMVYAAGSFRLDVSLRVEAGAYFVLLGPTGSGKTVCVECLAGLRTVVSGRVAIGGRDRTVAEPRLRAIGYVPQDYALFTNRTVRGNIAFGPEVRGWSHAATAAAVAETASILGIEPLLERRLNGLSGGERQRVALARALAVRPEILILDEPVSALDEFTRERVCGELRAVQQRLHLTTVHVCHNLEEALTVADAAAVMRDGRIEQAGTMAELLRRPRTEFVARFMRGENILCGVAEGEGPEPDTTCVRVAGIAFVVPGRHEGRVAFVARPENWTLRTQPTGCGHDGTTEGDGTTARREGSPRAEERKDTEVPNAVPVTVARAVDRGAYLRLELAGPIPLVVHLPRTGLPAAAADAAALVATVPTSEIHVLPAS